MKIKIFESIQQLNRFFGFKHDAIIIENDIDLIESECDLFERKRRDAEALCTIVANCTGNCLDIGTSQGRSAYKMATNLKDGIVYTVNALPEQITMDEKHITHLPTKDEIGSFYRRYDLKNVKQIYANTLNWDVPDNINDLSVVLVDGNHDTHAVYSDTKLAYARLREGGYILWHDFNPHLRGKFEWIDSVMSGVEKFVEEYGISFEIVHLRNSWIGIMRKQSIVDLSILPNSSQDASASTVSKKKRYKMMEWTDEKVQRYWDYESQFPENYFTYQVGKAVIHGLADYFPAAKNILDYGCGIGFLIPHMLELGLQVTALDFSLKSIEQVNTKFMHFKNFTGAFHLDQIINSNVKFDVIMVIEVLEHLNTSYLLQTIETLKKLLTKNGIVIFTTPNEENMEKQHIYCPECDSVFHRWQHVRSWSQDSLVSILTEHQMKVIDAFSTDFTAYQFDNKLLKNRSYTSNQTCIKLPHLVCIANFTSIDTDIIDTENLQALLKSSILELSLQNIKSAKKYLLECVRLYPSHTASYLALSELYTLENKNDDAIAILELALHNNPNNIEIINSIRSLLNKA